MFQRNSSAIGVLALAAVAMGGPAVEALAAPILITGVTATASTTET